MKEILRYKKEILLTFLGALLGGVISLSVGFYNLSKSLEFMQRKELTDTLRKDLITLRQVERELDKSMLLLMNENLIPVIEFAEIPKSREQTKKLQDKELSTFMQTLYGDGLKLNKYIMPKSGFHIRAWSPYRPYSQIDFDLDQELTDFYRKTEGVDYSLESIRQIIIYNPLLILPNSIYEIRRLVDVIKTDVSDISKEKILSIKNKVNSEAKRIEKELGRIK